VLVILNSFCAARSISTVIVPVAFGALELGHLVFWSVLVLTADF